MMAIRIDPNDTTEMNVALLMIVTILIVRTGMMTSPPVVPVVGEIVVLRVTSMSSGVGGCWDDASSWFDELPGRSGLIGVLGVSEGL